MDRQQTLIQGARILDPSQNLDRVTDLLIQDGKISKIGNADNLKGTDIEIVPANGCWLMPGLIDVHVHLREPGEESKETIESGTRAAAAGGFTSVACMANTSPVNDSAIITQFILERARQTGHCRVFPIGAVTKGLRGQELAEIGSMVEAGARAFSDDGLPVMNSYLLRKALDYTKAFDVPIISHAEDINLVGGGVLNEGTMSDSLGLKGNPAAAEEIMVARDISLAQLTGARVHIAHLTSRLGVEQIRRAKSRGVPITAEVTPHHLLLNEESLSHYDTHFKMAPPLRTQEDVLSLREALADGTIDMIATDHAPHREEDKQVEFEHACCGVTGIETALSSTLQLVRNQELSLERWIDAWTAQPAQLLGLDLGTIAIGSPADLTLVDPNREWTFHAESSLSKSKNSPFYGWSLKGKAIGTWIEGSRRYDER